MASPIALKVLFETECGAALDTEGPTPFVPGMPSTFRAVGAIRDIDGGLRSGHLAGVAEVGVNYEVGV